MRNLTPAEATRLGVYILGALVGAIFAVYGMLHNDGALIATGLTLLGTGSVAGSNVTHTADPGPVSIDGDELAALEDDDVDGPKHAAPE